MTHFSIEDGFLGTVLIDFAKPLRYADGACLMEAHLPDGSAIQFWVTYTSSADKHSLHYEGLGGDASSRLRSDPDAVAKVDSWAERLMLLRSADIFELMAKLRAESTRRVGQSV